MAARAARIDLEALLRARKLDNTLTSALPAPGVFDERTVVPTGIAVLDERLHGGVPRGQMSEVVGPRSSGRTSLLVALLAGATARGEIAALVDTLDMFDAVSAAACGIDLGRLLWVRGTGCPGGGVPECQGAGAWERVVDRAVKALNLVLQAGGFGLVALDLADVPPAIVRRLPFTTWLRLQRVIEGSETACVLLGAEPVARSAGGVTIALKSRGQPPSPAEHPQGFGEPRGQELNGQQASGIWRLAPGTVACDRHARLFLGLDVEAHLSRARWPETTPCRFQLGGSSQN